MIINKDFLKDPKCMNKKCTSGKRAMVLLGGIFVCCICASKFEKNKQKIMLEIMNGGVIVKNPNGN